MRFRSKRLQTGFIVTIFLFLFFLSLGALAPANASAAATADEQQMVNLVNQARSSAGLAPLVYDATLSSLARTKAQDMAANNYFSHTSPTYGSAFDMMKKAGVQYLYAGENLAKATSVSSAHNSLMASSGHRANILSTSFDRIGVGIVTQGSYKIVVQMFTGGQKTVTNTQTTTPTQTTTTTQTTSGLNADEQNMINLVNQERDKAGLSPLQTDLTLVKLARLKAQDMISKGYFSHTSPTYGSPFDMMKSYGVKYSYAGENLAGASTVQSAHTNLMNSSGHRANILSTNYTQVGIGVVSGGPYGKMFVQLFTG